jgi:hypothetical protein
MGGRGMQVGFWWGSQKEIDHYEDADLSGRKILKFVLEKQNGVVWTGLIWLRIGKSDELL